MANLRDFTGKNKIFTGTDSITVSKGTTGERVNGVAKLRFNTTTNLMEYYEGTDWKAIDAPPVVTGFTVDDVGGSSVTSATVNNEKTADSGLLTIEVNGSLFDTTGAGVTFIATAGNGETVNTQSITRNSANKLTVTVTASDFDVANSPYTIRVTNGSGLSANLEACISADADAPTFTNSADTNVNINDNARGSVSIAAADLVGASGVKASAGYAITTGSLPSGLSLNTTTGVITGSVSAVGSDTQTLFTITTTSTEGGTAARQFGITVKAPSITTFNSPGTFTVPASLTSVNVLMVAGGGGGAAEPGNNGPGGGGAGGLIYRPAFSISAGSPISVTVGSGGQGGTSSSPGNGNPGQGITGGAPNAFGANGSDTTFSTLTAKGGGGGACPRDYAGQGQGNPGGSGGGCVAMGGSPNTGGSATQPGQSGDSGTYGFGNAGGSIPNGTDGQIGGGGGGAGAAGGSGSGNAYAADASNLPTIIASGYGKGGVGKEYSISGSPVFYAGGGSGHVANSSGQNPGTYIPGGNGGGGNGGWQTEDNSGQQGTRPGTANRGGGGGAGRPGHGGDGGSGVVIVSF